MGGIVSKAAQREKWLKAVAKYGLALQDAPLELRADREVVGQAVAQNGYALEYASEALRADRGVVLEAVAQHGNALEYASEALRADRGFVLEAVAQDGYALEYASEALRADRGVVLEAVARNGRALRYASEALRADRELALQAVAQDGDALRYASEALRADREFMLQAVRHDGGALAYASRELRADRELALQAAAQHGYALRYASEALRADRGFVLEAVAQDGRALRRASEELRADREVALQAVRTGGFVAWFNVAEDLKQDPDILRAREACTSGLTQCRRITFPGRLPSMMGGQCAASFPGKFAGKWDELTKQRTDLSVACVFLTRPEDGLGKHGCECMCHRLYPQVSSEAYLAIMKKPQSEEEDRDYEKNLAFCKADAKAMGQVLIEEKAHPTEAAWEKAKQEARKTAQKLWKENDRRPPWGCRWFEMWKDNIEMAIKFKQELLVYFFPGKKGKGKVSWDKLNDEAIVQEALRDNGLGASQRAEVAWLDLMGYKYVELDVANF